MTWGIEVGIPELTVERVEVGAKVNGVEVDVCIKIEVGTV